MPRYEELTQAPRKVKPIILVVELSDSLFQASKAAQFVDGFLAQMRRAAERNADYLLKCCLIPCGTGCGGVSEKALDVSEVSSEMLFGDGERTIGEAMEAMQKILAREYFNQDQTAAEMGLHIPGIFMFSRFDHTTLKESVVDDLCRNELYLRASKVLICTDPGRTEREILSFVHESRTKVTLIALYDDPLDKNQILYRKMNREEAEETVHDLLYKWEFLGELMIHSGEAHPCLPLPEGLIPNSRDSQVPPASIPGEDITMGVIEIDPLMGEPTDQLMGDVSMGDPNDLVVIDPLPPIPIGEDDGGRLMGW